MKITFDPRKRQLTLAERDLDLAQAGAVFAGPTLMHADDRADYGEARFITIGYLDERMVIVVWTRRGDAYRIISMRKANDREQKIYQARLLG